MFRVGYYQDTQWMTLPTAIPWEQARQELNRLRDHSLIPYFSPDDGKNWFAVHEYVK